MIVEICIGSACHLKGSHQIVHKLQQLVQKDGLDGKVILKSSFCLGHCSGAVSIRIDADKIYSVSPDTVEQFYQKEVCEVIQSEVHRV